MSLGRRDLLKGAVLGAAGAVAYAAETVAAENGTVQSCPNDAANGPQVSPRPWQIIDANVHLFQWPFRRLQYDTVDGLAAKLKALHIKQAWAGSYEGLLHRDLDGVNTRLAEACRRAPTGLLVPFGSVNPVLPDWQEDLRRCHEKLAMPGIRLHPNYHGYTLRDERFEEILVMAAERGLRIQLVVAMEDTRTQHPQLQVPDVDLEPLADVISRVPTAKLMLLNFRPAGTVLERLAATRGDWFDTARIESTDGIATWMRRAVRDRFVFGSHAPLLVYEAALIKVYEAELAEAEVSDLLEHNASRFLQS